MAPSIKPGADDAEELVETGVAVALRLGVRAQMSLVHAVDILHNPIHRDRSPAATWWLDEAAREIAAMRKALEQDQEAA
jgi:hypothetical protein